MKNIGNKMTIFLAVLFSGLLLMGCNKDDIDPPEVNPQGKLLILQAYGNAEGGAPDGVSHSFVELYNISNEAVNLSGIGLYFANGTSVATAPNTATEDEAWERIALSGTLPAKTSYLLLGAKHESPNSALLQIEDGYGNINDNDLSLSRRAFKVALIQSTEELTVQNPFDTDGNGTKISGYLDMLGAANEYETRDLAFGFEAAPARNSASEAVRRQDNQDHDNNSEDFISIRYRTTGNATENAAGTPGITIGFDEWVLDHYKPKNSTFGSWNAFAEPTEPIPVNPIIPGAEDALAGKLLILQAYGTGGNAQAGVSHSFVELYNNTETVIDFDGIALYYADGVDNGSTIPQSTQDGSWRRIPLTGSIPAKGSYLILGPNNGNSNTRYAIPNNSGNINNPAFILSNRAFKVAIIRSTQPLVAQNPFDMGSGQKAAGYIDMIGAANTYPSRDSLYGFETSPARNSGSEAVRRKNLTDTNKNNDDFVSIRYASGGISNEELEVRKPRNATAGQWDPFADPAEPPEPGGESKTLMILQANNRGNADGGFSNSLVELYNNTDSEINLTAGNYYLHTGGTGDPGWTDVIKLEGIIPSQHSFLIVSSSEVNPESPSARHHGVALPTADQTAEFSIINTNFKVAVLRNQSTLLTVANPFGNIELEADYIDMFGAGTATGFETQAASSSRPQIARRDSLADTDNNRNDFSQYDSRAGDAINNIELYKFWPRNVAAEAWNPITGLPRIDPTPIIP